MSRDTAIRRMVGVESLIPEMREPFDVIQDSATYNYGYCIQEILKPIVTDSEQSDVGDFPNSVKEYFWIDTCVHTDRTCDFLLDAHWIAVGQLDTGAYFIFKGGCDYTGFECRGYMELQASASWPSIVEYGFTEAEFNAYVQATSPPAQ